MVSFWCIPFLALQIYKSTEPFWKHVSITNIDISDILLAGQTRASIGIFDMDSRRVWYIHILRIPQDMETETLILESV